MGTVENQIPQVIHYSCLKLQNIRIKSFFGVKCKSQQKLLKENIYNSRVIILKHVKLLINETAVQESCWTI